MLYMAIDHDVKHDLDSTTATVTATYIKVGRTRKMARRISEYETHRVNAGWIATKVGNVKGETREHHKLAKYGITPTRVKSEWCKIPDDMTPRQVIELLGFTELQ